MQAGHFSAAEIEFSWDGDWVGVEKESRSITGSLQAPEENNTSWRMDEPESAVYAEESHAALGVTGRPLCIC